MQLCRWSTGPSISILRFDHWFELENQRKLQYIECQLRDVMQEIARN